MPGETVPPLPESARLLFFFGGLPGIRQVLINGVGTITVFTFIPIPLFILMGELFFRTGLALRVFDALDTVLGRIPGRLSYLTVGGGALFSTLTGSSSHVRLTGSSARAAAIALATSNRAWASTMSS